MCRLPANAPSRWRRGPFWTHMTSSGGIDLPDDIWACSDQGVHYTARAYRDKLRELGIRQSMSRRACCWDNACIGSFWGRMEEQMGDTAHLPPRRPWRLPAGTPAAAAIAGGAGAPGMADPHGACRKVHCLAVCGDWGPPQNASGRISALVDMPIIPLGGIPCGREPASATLFIQRFPNRFPPCGQAREIWKRMSAKLRRLHGLDLLFEPAI
jgi:hypothetical protein